MWLHTTILTLLFFPISLGFGFFILSLASITLIEQSRLTRLQFVLLGFIIGAPAIATLVQLLSLISANIKLHLGILSLISLFGLAATWAFWRPRTQDWVDIARWTALALPLAFITWWWSFGAFSSFPFGDIGADVHWMKTAQEYANTGVINPYASQSYVDLRPALAGALSGTFGLDLLQFNWVYRYFSVLGFLAAYYAVADSIFADPRRKWLAFFLAAAGNVLGLATNGSLAVIGSFTYLTVLLTSRDAARPHNTRSLFLSIMLPTAGGLLAIVFAFIINNNALMLALLLVIPGLFNVLNRSGKVGHNIATQTFASVAWPAALMFLHRSSYLFIPIAIASWLFYIAAANCIREGRPLVLKTLRIAALVLPCICFSILAWVLATRLGYLQQPAMNANHLFSYVTVVLIGRTIQRGDEMALGAGPDVAALEIGRVIGPFFAVGIGLLLCWYIGKSSMRSPVGCSRRSAETARLLWSWIAGCALCIVALSGFPFLYRTVFVSSGFFTITATDIFSQMLTGPGTETGKRRRLVGCVAGISVAALVVGLYAFNWGIDYPSAGYQAAFRVWELTGLALVLVFAALTFAYSPRTQVLALAATIGLGIALDRAGLAILLMPHAFGKPPTVPASIVSHYDASDLGAAHWLHDNKRRAVLISDPYTLGMTQALTGAPGIYLFSNLDTVNQTIADRAKAAISAIIEPASKEDKARKTCISIAPILADLNQEALAQIGHADRRVALLRPVRPAREVQDKTLPTIDAEDAARIWNGILPNSGSGGWNVVAGINPRTINWLRLDATERLSYFPSNEPLDPKIVDSLKNGPFPVVFFDGQNAIVSLECTDASMNLDDRH
jgi:hypothetical protein